MESTKFHFGGDFPLTTIYRFDSQIMPNVQLAADGTGFFQELKLFKWNYLETKMYGTWQKRQIQK